MVDKVHHAVVTLTPSHIRKCVNGPSKCALNGSDQAAGAQLSVALEQLKDTGWWRLLPWCSPGLGLMYALLAWPASALPTWGLPESGWVVSLPAVEAMVESAL